MFWPEGPHLLFLGQTCHHSDEIGRVRGGLTVDSHPPTHPPTTTVLEELEEGEKESVGGVSGSEKERLNPRARAKVVGSG